MSNNIKNSPDIDEFIKTDADTGIDEFDSMPIQQKQKDSKKSQVIKIICIAVAIILAACYIYWMISDSGVKTALSRVSALACVLMFGLCAIYAVRPTADMLTLTNRNPLNEAGGARSERFFSRHPWITIFITIIVTRFLLYCIAYFVCMAENGYSGGLFETLRSTWQHSTDSNSYIGIAQDWYTNDVSLDRHQHIVFFPMYPIMIKLIAFVVRDYFAAAIIVSNVCAGLGGIFLYELASIDMPRRDALRVTKYLFLMPAACFFGTHMSESLFLMLCVLSMLLVRKKKYLWGCVVGAFASFTRSPGVIILVPIFIEYVADQCAMWRAGDKKAFWKEFWQRGLSMMIVPLGLIAYFIVNYTVWGDPFYFMAIQKSNWSTGFGWIFNTASYLVSYMLGYLENAEIRMVLGLSIPQLVCIFGSLWLMLATVKKQRPSYMLYFLVYFFIVIGVQWLLSAPRYLTVAFPLAFALALLTKNKAADIIVTIIMAALMIGYSCMLVMGYPVY